MLKVLKHPNPILEEEMPAFDFSNPIMDPKELETQMLEAMYAHDGIGLAAPQVGIKTRAFVIGHKTSPENSFAVFNPEVVDCSTDIHDLEEGCLSFPNVFAKIKRPAWVVVRYQDKEGVTQESKLEGYDCKCFLHEMDHLNGINFKDRLSTLKWAMAVKKARKGR